MHPLFAFATALSLAVPAGPGGSDVRLEGFPHVRQRPDFCGEACAEMVLRRLGSAMDQDDVFALGGVDPSLGRGAWTADLARALRAIGFRVGDVWTRVPAAGAPAALETAWAALHADLVAGIPSIVCMRWDDAPGAPEHFRLVTGYDAARDEVIYNEPAEDDGGGRRMARPLFLDLWPLRYDPAEWLLVRLRMEPGAMVEVPRPAGRSAADYAQAAMRVRESLPGPGFTVVVEPPFVVAGDEDAEVVRARVRGTVRWAAARLKADFFRADPDRIVTVWLFRDRESYERNATALFGERPSTPYGYFLDRESALVMNIATGGGTLVHEMVHPFVRADFPGCPPWLNEGLGSLFEQCGDCDGHICGMVNWRLAGLRRAIRAGSLPSFETLLAMDADRFYGDDRGDNYAQARYLCQYLQERGLLAGFYRRFRADRDVDPTGLATLRDVLGVDDLDAFTRQWLAWVAALR